MEVTPQASLPRLPPRELRRGELHRQRRAGSGRNVLYGVTTGVTMADTSQGMFASNVTEFESIKQ
jgi:hypothetical protein